MTSQPICPSCSRTGRLVSRRTLEAMLKPEALSSNPGDEYRFCSTHECPLVYYGPNKHFERGDLTTTVFQKEPSGRRTVCYCFDVSEEDIRREITETGESTAVERISNQVRAENCACEVRNPQGACCLSNVAAVASRLGACS